MADLSQTTANVKAKAANIQGSWVQVGEAVTEGQPGYKGTGNKYMLDDADTSNTLAGVFLTPASTDGYAFLCTFGDIDLGATLAVGEQYIVSATAGKIAPIGDLATADYTKVIGVASAADTIRVEPKTYPTAKA